MSRVLDAVSWTGCDVTLSLFGVHTGEPTLFDATVESMTPVHRLVFEVADDAEILGGWRVFCHDLVFPELPADLPRYLRFLLARAIAAGHRVAWFGFEGSFDLRQVLGPQVADQIYAVCGQDGVASLALTDAELCGESWAAHVAAIRRHID